FGAICRARALGTALVLPRADASAMQHHLDEISRCVAADAHAVLTLDKAGWHTTRKLQVPSNISLLHLPPASPELNPTENISQYMRQTYLSNRVFSDYDDVVAASSSAWNKLVAQPGRIDQSAPEAGPQSVKDREAWYYNYNCWMARLGACKEVGSPINRSLPRLPGGRGGGGGSRV